MRPLLDRAVQAYLVAHWGVITRQQALDLGVSRNQIDRAVATGRWEAVHPGVYRLSGVPLRPQGAALAACHAAGPGAVISHRSAALVWGLVDQCPRPSVSGPWPRHPRLAGVEVHRSGDLHACRPRARDGLRVTDPCRTLVDLGQVLHPRHLDAAVDRARVEGLVAIASLEKEARRLARPGRQGPAAMQRALRRRGFVEGPESSVLESRVARLLAQWGIRVVSVQTAVLDGRYRIDFLLEANVALEVDGFAYHSSPEAKAADAKRRFELRMAGWFVVEADWILVMRRPGELRRLLLDAVHRDQTVAAR